MGHNLRAILRYCPTQAMELFSALLAVLWGLRLPSALGIYGLTPLALVAPEAGWGGALLGAGTLHLLGLARPTGRLRRAAPATMCALLLLWSFIMVAIAVAGPAAPGLWTYVLLTAKHILLLTRLLVDRRLTHDSS